MRNMNMARLSVAIAVVAACIASAFADEVKIDGVVWKYSIVDGEVMVGNCWSATEMRKDRTYRAIDNTLSGEISIPEKIGGLPVTKISSSAFFDCSRMTSIVIPASVNEIGYYAFSGCSSLKKIVLKDLRSWCEINAHDNPLSLTSAPALYIGENALGGHLDIPDSTEFVSYNAFYKQPIVSVTIPASVKKIGANAFSSCPKLESVVIEDGCTIIGTQAFYSCSSLQEVNIPSSVVTIDSYAFQYCSKLSRIDFSSKALEIGAKAFYGCYLPTITFPKNVDRLVIGDSSFYNARVVELALPEGIVSIGSMAFSSALLESVYIPSTLTYLTSKSFPSSVKIVISPDNPVIVRENGIILNKETNEWICLTDEADINIKTPDGVETFDLSLLEGKRIGRFELADSVTYLDGSLWNTSIKEFVSGKGLQYLYTSFASCGVTNVVLNGTALTVGPSCFSGCSQLERVDLRESVISIDEQAFMDCSALKEVVGTKGLVRIQREAFCACSSLEKFEFPASLKKIGCRAFVACAKLRKVVIPEGVAAIESETFWQCCNIDELSLPNTCYLIERRAFEECDNITKFSLPCQMALYNANWGTGNELVQVQVWYDGEKNQVRYDMWVNGSIGYPGSYCEYEFVDTTNFLSEAFPNCYRHITDLSLKPMQFSAGIEMYGEYDATAIRASFAEGCTLLKTLVIEEGVTAIGAYSFFGCSNIESVVFPSTIKTVNAFAFAGCKKIPELLFSDGLENVCENAFDGCSSVEKIVLGNSLKIAAQGAFQGCTLVESLDFPASVIRLENASFVGFDNLRCIVMRGGVPEGFGESGLMGDRVLVYYTQEYGAEWQKVVPLDNAVGLYHGERGVVTVSSFLPRENDASVLEVKYVVNSKKPSVKVRVLAFEDGVHSFAKVIRPATFVDGTETGVGDDIAPGEERMLAWQVASDWATKLSKVDFEVMALEGGLLPLETIQIPANGDHKAVVVSWNKMQDGQVLDALYWLYADSDSELSLENGVLKRNDTGTILVEGETIVNPHAAVDYVYAKMGYETLSGEALDYVRDATDLNFNPDGIRQYAYKVVE